MKTHFGDHQDEEIFFFDLARLNGFLVGQDFPCACELRMRACRRSVRLTRINYLHLLRGMPLRFGQFQLEHANGVFWIDIDLLELNGSDREEMVWDKDT
jgi:hypothetical protein